MNVHFSSSRTAARNLQKDSGGKFKDFGKEAPKGERWGVLSDTIEVAKVATVSKKSLASSIYVAGVQAGLARKDIIANFMSDGCMTLEGAKTYHYNFSAAQKKFAAEQVKGKWYVAL